MEVEDPLAIDSPAATSSTKTKSTIVTIDDVKTLQTLANSAKKLQQVSIRGQFFYLCVTDKMTLRSFVDIRVTRFFSVQYTKTGKITTKCTKWPYHLAVKMTN
jgi:predicted PhzF superfamily epimerase YddE/YHI9